MKKIFALIKRQTKIFKPNFINSFKFSEHMVTPEERHVINTLLFNQLNTMDTIKINNHDIENFFKQIQTMRTKIDAIESDEAISLKYNRFIKSIFEKEIVNQQNADILLSNIFSTACLLKNSDDNLWGMIEVLYYKYGKYICKLY